MRLVDGLRRSHLAVFVGIALASSAVAQTPPTSAQPQQQFRDPKTGQIWTPQNVGRISGPNTPAEPTFMSTAGDHGTSPTVGACTT